MKKLFTSVLFLLVSSYLIAQNYTLNGSAKRISNNVFQLTPDLPERDKTGTIWYQNRINLRYDFSIKTRIFFGNNDEGGDGIAFVLQPSGSTQVGGGGEGIGYSGIKPSLVVEFDTYPGTTNGDPVQDHLAILKNGDINHNSLNRLAGPYALAANIEDKQWHDATFSWSASTSTLTVSFLSQTYTYKGDVVNSIFGGNPSVFWGFTASTGFFTNLQQVEVVSFIDCADLKFPPPAVTAATCNQSNGTITVNDVSGGSGSYQYSKDNGTNFQESNVFSGLAAGTYPVVVKDKAGAMCKSDVQQVIIRQTGPGTTYTTLIVNSGAPYPLSARSDVGISYSWSPADGLNEPKSSTPTVTTSKDITYLITITSASGCITVDTQKVQVAKPITGNNKDSVVAVPTAFTPNKNGMNDRLKPIPYAMKALTYFRVFNRWGQLVFETSSVGMGWDGTLGGTPQPAETYTWILECISTSGTKVRRSGRSVLIR